MMRKNPPFGGAQPVHAVAEVLTSWSSRWSLRRTPRLGRVSSGRKCSAWRSRVMTMPAPARSELCWPVERILLVKSRPILNDSARIHMIPIERAIATKSSGSVNAARPFAWRAGATPARSVDRAARHAWRAGPSCRGYRRIRIMGSLVALVLCLSVIGRQHLTREDAGHAAEDDERAGVGGRAVVAGGLDRRLEFDGGAVDRGHAVEVRVADLARPHADGC